MNTPLQEARGCNLDSSKPCACCQKTFACCGLECWCQLVSVDPVALKKLSSTFDDCLCPSCLEKHT